MKGWETLQSSLVMCALKWRPYGIKLIWKISQFLGKTKWLRRNPIEDGAI